MVSSKQTLRPRHWTSPAIVAVYLVVGLFEVVISRWQFNPDVLGYTRTALYYLQGRWDLAINGHWSPMLSWLLLPVLALGHEPLLAIKLLNLVAGLCTAWGVSSLLKRLGVGAGWRQLAMAMMLCVALLQLTQALSPDMLVAALAAWYFRFALDWLEQGRMRSVVFAGLLAGAGYLTKAYFLPFALIHLSLTALLRLRVTGKPGRVRVIRQGVTGVFVLVMVALPWAVALSLHYRHPTISTAAKHAVGDVRLPSTVQTRFPYLNLQWPREGRIAAGEDSSEVRGQWPTWSPLDGVRGMKNEVRVLSTNFSVALRAFSSIDQAGLIVPCVIVALLTLRTGRISAADPADRFLLWAGASALLFCLGYIQILLLDRYLWPVWGLLVALALLAAQRACAGETPDTPATGLRARLVSVQPVMAVLLAFSMAGAVSVNLHDWVRFPGAYDYTSTFKESVDALNVEAPLAVAGPFDRGQAVAFWKQKVVLGQVQGQTAEEIAAELSPFGRPTLLVIGRPELEPSLAASAQFERVGKTPMVSAYRLVSPGPATQPVPTLPAAPSLR